MPILDENAQGSLEAVECELAAYERELREQAGFPLDSLPVSVNQVAIYRNLYLHTLRQLINRTDLLRRLMVVGGNPIFDVMCDLNSKLPCEDGRRYPRVRSPGEDGGRQG